MQVTEATHAHIQLKYRYQTAYVCHWDWIAVYIGERSPQLHISFFSRTVGHNCETLLLSRAMARESRTYCGTINRNPRGREVIRMVKDNQQPIMKRKLKN